MLNIIIFIWPNESNSRRTQILNIILSIINFCLIHFFHTFRFKQKSEFLKRTQISFTYKWLTNTHHINYMLELFFLIGVELYEEECCRLGIYSFLFCVYCYPALLIPDHIFFKYSIIISVNLVFFGQLSFLFGSYRKIMVCYLFATTFVEVYFLFSKVIRIYLTFSSTRFIFISLTKNT